MGIELNSPHAGTHRGTGRSAATMRVSALARFAVAGLAVAAVTALAGCAPTPIPRAYPVDSATVGANDPASSQTPSAPATPSPGATQQAPRAMQVGDCLNKVAVDELGLPVPEYIDCAQPHMFEVTAIVRSSKGDADFDFDAIDDARRARCRAEYESYTGRDSRDMGNAFGWDQLTEPAWSAGAVDYSCYATAPGFGDLTGSLAR